MLACNVAERALKQHHVDSPTRRHNATLTQRQNTTLTHRHTDTTARWHNSTLARQHAANHTRSLCSRGGGRCGGGSVNNAPLERGEPQGLPQKYSADSLLKLVLWQHKEADYLRNIPEVLIADLAVPAAGFVSVLCRFCVGFPAVRHGCDANSASDVQLVEITVSLNPGCGC
jgi:hypothetical protein